MPELRPRVRGEYSLPGGIVGYPLERLREEVAFIAVGLGWSYEEIMSMTHRERAEWVRTLNQLNTRR